MKQKQKRKEETMKAELGYKPQKKRIKKIENSNTTESNGMKGLKVGVGKYKHGTLYIYQKMQYHQYPT